MMSNGLTYSAAFLAIQSFLGVRTFAGMEVEHTAPTGHCITADCVQLLPVPHHSRSRRLCLPFNLYLDDLAHGARSPDQRIELH